MQSRREFLKRLGAIATAIGVSPDALIQPVAVTAAIQKLSTGDAAGLMNLSLLSGQIDDLNANPSQSVLPFIEVPLTFTGGEAGASPLQRAGLYLQSLNREELMRVVIKARADKTLEQAKLGNLHNGILIAIDKLFKSDTAFIQQLHGVSGKLGQMILEEFFTLHPPEKNNIPTLDEIKTQHPDARLTPEDVEFISRQRANWETLLASKGKEIPVEKLHTLMGDTFRFMSDGHSHFTEAVDNIFGVEGVQYHGKAPVNDKGKQALESLVQNLLSRTDCSIMSAEDKSRVTDFLCNPKFWNAPVNAIYNAFGSSTDVLYTEHNLYDDVEKYVNSSAADAIYETLFGKDIHKGQMQFQTDLFRGLSHDLRLPEDYREHMREWAEHRQPRMNDVKADNDSQQQKTPENYKTPQEPEPKAAFHAADTQLHYEAGGAPLRGGDFGIRHSWFERLLHDQQQQRKTGL